MHAVAWRGAYSGVEQCVPAVMWCIEWCGAVQCMCSAVVWCGACSGAV